MDDMNCSEARHALWPPERPRLAEAEVLEARRHVQGCAACESYFAQDRVLLEAFDRASQERAPQSPSRACFRCTGQGEVEESRAPANEAGPSSLGSCRGGIGGRPFGRRVCGVSPKCA